MNETELSAAIQRELDNALGSEDGELSTIRAKAWDYFLGEPRGDEKTGRSQVISTDLAEVLDWVMPEVLRALASGENAAEFAAHGEQDEDQAELETKAVNHIFFKQNNGLLTLHDWFQEALLQKTGYVCVWWDDRPEYETSDLEGLVDQEIAAYEADENTEITRHEVYQDETVGLDLHDISIRTRTKKGRLRVECVPSNEARVNSDHRDVTLQTARFAGRQRQVPASELVEMGYDRDLVDSLPTYDDTADDEEEIAREHVSDEQDWDDEPSDPSQRKIMFTEAYWLVDMDDDGISERRLVHYAGHKFLQNEEVDRVGLIAITGMPLANKHLGRSLYDKIKQIQDIKTALWRQVIDNLFLVNNSRHAVVESEVSISDLLTSRPGGIVRQKRPGMIEPLKTPQIGPEAFTFLEYLDKAREERTGVGPEVVSELGQLANTTAWGIERLMAKKEELIGLMVAIMRSTGVNELFEVMHAILRENAEDPLDLPIDGKWEQVSPKQWPVRTAVPPVTWSGMGDRIEKQKTLQYIMSLQEKAAQYPLTAFMVTPENLYEAADDFVRTSGMQGVGQYLIDPRSPEGAKARQVHQVLMQQQEQRQDPQIQALAQVEEIRGQYKAQIEQLRELNKREMELLKAQMAKEKSDREYQEHVDEINLKYDELDQRMVEKMTELELQHTQQLPRGLA